jgi:hypothetical protein
VRHKSVKLRFALTLLAAWVLLGGQARAGTITLELQTDASGAPGAGYAGPHAD